MARPQSVTDEAILSAARRIILKRGYERFTLSEVAKQVGLSRAALILRFKSADALRLRMTSEMVDRFVQELDTLPIDKSGDGLLALVAFIGARTQHRARVAQFFTILRANVRDAKLAALERKRGVAWYAAISARMPKTKIPHQAAVRSFAALLTGAISQWEATPGLDSNSYLNERARDWLTLAGIRHSKRPPRTFIAKRQREIR